MLVPVLVLAAATPAMARDKPKERPPKPPRTFDSVLDTRRRADGTLPKKVAIAAFETAIGPLPGTKVKLLPSRGLRESTRAIEELFLGVWGELTTEQQEAARALFAPRLARAQPVPSTAGPAGGQSAHAVLPDDAAVGHMLDELRAEIAGRLGRDLSVPLTFEVGEYPDSDPTDSEVVLAGATSLDAGGDVASTEDFGSPPAGCWILIDKKAIEDLDNDVIRSVLAHEVFHCFQRSFGGRPIEVHRNRSDWIKEGQAEWVGEDIAGPTHEAAGFWDDWLLGTTDGLFGRSYDAIGFYSDLEANGIDPWSIFDPVLAASEGGDIAAFDAAVGATGTDFLSTMAKALVRERPLGDEWEQTGSGLPGTNGSEKVLVTPEKTEEAGTRASGRCGLGCAGRSAIERTVPLEDYSTKPYTLELDGDLVQIVTTAPQGALGFRDGTSVTTAPGVVQNICLRPDGCVCDDGGRPFGGAALVQQEPGKVGFAIASPTKQAVSVAFGSIARDDACAVGHAGLDHCLLGTWMLDLPTLTETLQGRFAESGADVEALGHGTLTFHASTYESDLQLELVATNDISGVGPVEAHVKITGGGRARYEADGFGILQEGVATDFAVDVSVNVGGRSVANVPVAIPGAGDIGEDLFAPASYACPDESRLVMTPPEGLAVPFVKQE